MALSLSLILRSLALAEPTTTIDDVEQRPPVLFIVPQLPRRIEDSLREPEQEMGKQTMQRHHSYLAKVREVLFLFFFFFEYRALER